MKRLLISMILFTIVILPSTLWAADPIIGTWKLNVDKSKNLSSQYVIVKIEEYREIEGGQIEAAIEGTITGGQPVSNKFIFPRQGGMVKYHRVIREGISDVETLIAPGEWIVTRMENGKQVSIRHKIVSKDGKTMSQKVREIDAKGQPFESLFVYEKQ